MKTDTNVRTNLKISRALYLSTGQKMMRLLGGKRRQNVMLKNKA